VKLLFAFLALFFIQTYSEAQEQNGDQADLTTYASTFEYTKKIQKEIEEVKDLPADKFFKNIDRYRESIEKYFEHKKRVCNGEFSTIILTEGAESKTAKTNKLSVEERKLCFREMKALQTTYINYMFLARKRYLDFLHERRIAELMEARKEAIDSLQSSFAPSDSKKSRR
jgi:site-specific DNA-cytosine methylase